VRSKPFPVGRYAPFDTRSIVDTSQYATATDRAFVQDLFPHIGDRLEDHGRGPRAPPRRQHRPAARDQLGRQVDVRRGLTGHRPLTAGMWRSSLLCPDAIRALRMDRPWRCARRRRNPRRHRAVREQGDA
jgi:hypothetical protein